MLDEAAAHAALGPQVVGQGGRVRPRHAHHHVGLLAFLSGYEFDLHRVGTIGSYHLETGVAGNRVFADWPQHAAADRADNSRTLIEARYHPNFEAEVYTPHVGDHLGISHNSLGSSS